MANRHFSPAKANNEDYFTLPSWQEALQHIEGGVSILVTEFHRKHVGKVKRISGTVIYHYRQPIGGTVLEQSTLLDVTWKHSGLCYQRTTRRPEYDVDKFLK